MGSNPLRGIRRITFNAVVAVDVVLDSTTEDRQRGFEMIDLVLEIIALVWSWTRLLFPRVDTCATITRTPATYWLHTVTFDFS